MGRNCPLSSPTDVFLQGVAIALSRTGGAQHEVAGIRGSFGVPLARGQHHLIQAPFQGVWTADEFS